MSKAVKRMIIDDIRERLGDVRTLLIVEVSRMDGVAANRMRLGAQEKGFTLLSVKNTLAQKALSEVGVTGLEECMQGPSTLVWGGEDIVQLSKEITRWAREFDQFEIKGGAVEGQVVDAKGVEALSKSPSRLELIGQIAGLLLSPGARLSAALLGPGGKLAGQLQTLSEKEGDATEAA